MQREIGAGFASRAENVAFLRVHVDAKDVRFFGERTIWKEPIMFVERASGAGRIVRGERRARTLDRLELVGDPGGLVRIARLRRPRVRGGRADRVACRN